MQVLFKVCAFASYIFSLYIFRAIGKYHVTVKKSSLFWPQIIHRALFFFFYIIVHTKTTAHQVHHDLSMQTSGNRGWIQVLWVNRTCQLSASNVLRTGFLPYVMEHLSFIEKWISVAFFDILVIFYASNDSNRWIVIDRVW